MSDAAKPRILVVEDDPDLRRILRLQLTSLGFAVAEAPDGAAGFAAVQEQRPDCVLLDLMMPVLDGFGFLKRIRSVANLQDIPVIIVTASEDERSRIRGYQYQADAYMAKPYDLEALVAQIKRLVATAAVD